MKKKIKKVERIGLVANISKPSCASAIQKAVELISKNGVEILTEPETGKFACLTCQIVSNIYELATRTDIIIVFGGDGTILRVAREIAGSQTPLLGVNLGKLGFLTAVQANELETAINQLWNKEIVIETRPLIEATGSPYPPYHHQLAMNDFVISKGATSRMIELEVNIDGVPLTRYRCDGLIVSSPTGSTAYSLAAGGAIVSPDAPVFTITPICPHTLTNRSLIVSLESTIQIKYLTHHIKAMIAADSQVENEVKEGDLIIVRKSKYTVNLAHLSNSSFYETLRHKLNWSGSPV